MPHCGVSAGPGCVLASCGLSSASPVEKAGGACASGIRWWSFSEKTQRTWPFSRPQGPRACRPETVLPGVDKDRDSQTLRKGCFHGLRTLERPKNMDVGGPLGEDREGSEDASAGRHLEPAPAG